MIRQESKRKIVKIKLPNPQVEAGDDRTNSMHLPHFLSSSSTRITGKHSGCVTLPTELQHAIVLPFSPTKLNVRFIIGPMVAVYYLCNRQ